MLLLINVTRFKCTWCITILYLDSDWSQIELTVVEVLHSWLISVRVLVKEESLDDAALAHFWASDDHQSYPLVSHL